MHWRFFPGLVVLGLAFVLKQTAAAVASERIHVS